MKSAPWRRASVTSTPTFAEPFLVKGSWACWLHGRCGPRSLTVIPEGTLVREQEGSSMVRPHSDTADGCVGEDTLSVGFVCLARNACLGGMGDAFNQVG